MNKEKIYNYLNKHLFLRHIVIGVRYHKDGRKLNEIIGRSKKSFNVNSYGNKNFGKVIYNIVINDRNSGFFAINRFILDALYCSNMMGFIPYVRVINSKYNDSPNKDDNMFEYFYQQPAGITFEDVLQSVAVVEFKDEHKGWVEDKYKTETALLAGYDFDLKLIDELAMIAKEKLLLKSDVKNQINTDMGFLDHNIKILGIHFRGNAFKVGFNGHPICLEIEDYYPFIDEAIGSGFQKIFVATDDKIALNKLVEKYVDRIIYYSDTSRSDDGIDVQDNLNRGEKTGYRLGYEVLRDVKTLANCDALICGKSQVSFAVMVEKKTQNKEFEYLKIIDHGVYEKDISGKVKKYKKISR